MVAEWLNAVNKLGGFEFNNKDLTKKNKFIKIKGVNKNYE